MKIILYIASLLSLITYLFWNHLPKGSFYIGNSLFIMLICLYLYLSDKESVIKFVLFSLSLNNFADEILFDNMMIGINEVVFGISIILIAIIKTKNARKRT